MIDVAGIDLGAARQKQRGDLHRAREVKGHLSITAAGADEGWVTVEHRSQPVDQSQPGRGMSRERRTAAQQVLGHLVARAIQDAEAPRPPLAPLVDIGAQFDQQVPPSRVVRSRPRG
jgi:hypothetical protein